MYSIQVIQPGKEHWSQFRREPTLADVIGAILGSPVSGIDLRQPIGIIQRDPDDNGTFWDIEDPERWQKCKDHFKKQWNVDLSLI